MIPGTVLLGMKAAKSCSCSRYFERVFEDWGSQGHLLHHALVCCILVFLLELGDSIINTYIDARSCYRAQTAAFKTSMYTFQARSGKAETRGEAGTVVLVWIKLNVMRWSSW